MGAASAGERTTPRVGGTPPAGMSPLPQRAMDATGRRPAIVPQAFVSRRYDVGGQLTPFAARAYHTATGLVFPPVAGSSGGEGCATGRGTRRRG
jgi:hypothetical protein